MVKLFQEKNLKKQLEKSIKLAHLKLPSKEKKYLLKDLGKILHFVGIISRAEKEGERKFGKNLKREEKEFPQLQKRNDFRSDLSETFLNRKGLLGEIPSKKKNLIKIKKI